MGVRGVRNAPIYRPRGIVRDLAEPMFQGSPAARAYRRRTARTREVSIGVEAHAPIVDPGRFVVGTTCARTSPHALLPPIRADHAGQASRTSGFTPAPGVIRERNFRFSPHGAVAATTSAAIAVSPRWIHGYVGRDRNLAARCGRGYDLQTRFTIAPSEQCSERSDGRMRETPSGALGRGSSFRGRALSRAADLSAA